MSQAGNVLLTATRLADPSGRPARASAARDAGDNVFQVLLDAHDGWYQFKEGCAGAWLMIWCSGDRRRMAMAHTLE